MSPAAKIAIGLAAVLLLAWLSHGPLGRGSRFIDRIETQARQVAVDNGLPEIEVRLARHPLARAATLSGTADEFQRYGMPGQKGLTQLVGDVGGMGWVGWADRPSRGIVLPLLAETLLLFASTYGLGIAVAWMFWGRPPRTKFAP